MIAQAWISELVDWSSRLMARSVDFEPTQAQWQPERCGMPLSRAEGRAFRLTAWPELPPELQTADVYRALSLMSTRPVNLLWLQSRSRLDAAQTRLLLQVLLERDAVQIVDGGGALNG